MEEPLSHNPDALRDLQTVHGEVVNEDSLEMKGRKPLHFNSAFLRMYFVSLPPTMLHFELFYQLPDSSGTQDTHSLIDHQITWPQGSWRPRFTCFTLLSLFRAQYKTVLFAASRKQGRERERARRGFVPFCACKKRKQRLIFSGIFKQHFAST